MRRILVVRPDNLGDVVMTTPALRALRAAAPRARIELLVSPAGAAARPLVPELDGMLVVSPSWQDVSARSVTDPLSSAWREQALVRMLAVRGYDAMLVFTSARQSPWPAAHVGLLAGIPIRAVHSVEFGGAVATHWVTPPPEDVHQVDRCLHLLGELGVPARGHELTLRIPESAAVAAATVLEAAGLAPDDRFVLLAPGASCAARRYPAPRFGQVARHVADTGLPVLVTGNTREQGLTAAVARAADHPLVRVLGQVTVPVLTAVVARAAVVLCNNSGCLHLADATATPVVVTYSGTERLGEMRPRIAPSVLLRREVSCSPCRQFRCPYRLECLDVAPEEVASAVLRLAGAPGARAADLDGAGQPPVRQGEGNPHGADDTANTAEIPAGRGAHPGSDRRSALAAGGAAPEGAGGG